MKSLLFVIPTMRMGGAEKSLVSLLKALDPQRVQADLLLFEGGGVLQDQIPDWVHVIEADPVTRGMTLELRYYLKDLAKHDPAAALARIRMKAGPVLRRKLGLQPLFNWDIAKMHIPKLEKRYDVAIGYLEGVTDFYVIDKVDAYRKIGWIHTDISRIRSAKEAARYYSQFHTLVTITDACCVSIIRQYPDFVNKTVVIPNIVPREEIRQKADENISFDHIPEGYEIATVGRLEHVKGIDIAVDACRILADRKIPIRWRVYGEGSNRRKLEEQIERLSLEQIFTLCGTVSNPYPYMKAADILVQPSRREGKSVVLDEAKILGKAIVATNYPSVTDQIRHGEDGWIVDMTPESLADGIEYVMNVPGLRIRMEEACRNTPDETPGIIERFYRLIGESSGADEDKSTLCQS